MKIPQLVYSNVEAEKSPRGRRGFQTLVSTTGILDARAQADVETRLFFTAAPGDPPKYFYFQAAGRFVVGRAAALEGTDGYGRTGRYLAHALLLDSRSFRELGNDPFRVLDAFPFLESPEQALSQADFGRAHIDGADLEPAPVVEPPVPALSPASLRAWLLCGLEASQMLDARRPVAVVGDRAAALPILRWLLGVLPEALRPSCTFDTAYQGGSPAQTPYWSVVAPARTSVSAGAVFDLAGGSFTTQPQLAAKGYHAIWATAAGAGSEDPLPPGAAALRTAYETAQWIAGEAPEPAASPTAGVLELARPDLRARALAWLDERLGQTLAGRLSAAIVSRDKALVDAAHRRLDTLRLAELVHGETSGWPSVPPPGERSAATAAELGRSAHLPDLLLRGLWWQGAEGDEALAARLLEAAEGVQRDFVRWCVRTARARAVAELAAGDAQGVVLRFEDGEPGGAGAAALTRLARLVGLGAPRRQGWGRRLFGRGDTGDREDEPEPAARRALRRSYLEALLESAAQAPQSS